MASDVIGRVDEIERLQAFLDGSVLDGPRALVLEGDAGIGKSTIWLRGLELAQKGGFRVLSSRPAAAEQSLTFAGLGDLFEDILDDVLPALPPPRKRALEVALLVVDEGKDPLDPRALGVAVRSSLELLAETQPLVLAVDDVQWFDRPSADALGFALRRTRAPLRVMLARRFEPTTVESSLPAPSVEHLNIGPLSPGALQAVFRQRLERAFARPTLVRIHDMSVGNPFYALEIARALPHQLDPTQPLPVPETLEELVRTRIDALPETSREALVLLSAMGEGDVESIRKARAGEALEAAVSHGIVERVADRLRFTHPLLASSVYQGADDATRRSSHAVLAGIVRDPLQSARHLALAAEGPDANIAASLDQAAAIASVRGTPNAAAELAELARRLTPDDDREGRHRRSLLVATAHLRAGDVQGARASAEETLAEAPDDGFRSEALVLLSAVEAASGNLHRAIALRREALSEAATHPALQAAIRQWLAANLPYLHGAQVKEGHARASLALAEQLDDDLLRAGALATLAMLRFGAGEPDALALAEQAHALATSQRNRDEEGQQSTEVAHLLAWRTYDRLDLLASFLLAAVLIQIGHFDRARELLDGLEQELARRDELLQTKLLWFRMMLELHAGRWSLAHDLVKRERDIAVLYERAESPGLFVTYAELALHRGELAHAREFAAHARELAVAQLGSNMEDVEATLGLVDCAGGDPLAALGHFAAADAGAEACGWREPVHFWWRADYAEALLELGRVDDAVELLDAWEPNARRLGRDRILAQVTRCRGLVAAARGDVDLALATLEQAVDEADAIADRLAHARALLALGVVRRRARQKRAARGAITEAVAIFDECGAEGWAEKARAELGRIGGRRREEGLTPAEKRVAALVAEGRTNREVATALFLSEGTVETHLSHIYTKLGVRSRTELARVHGSEF